MLAGLMVDGETIITEPERSRDHSERMLAAFGAKVSVDIDSNTVSVKGGAKLIGQEVTVPGISVPPHFGSLPHPLFPILTW